MIYLACEICHQPALKLYLATKPGQADAEGRLVCASCALDIPDEVCHHFGTAHTTAARRHRRRHSRPARGR